MKTTARKQTLVAAVLAFLGAVPLSAAPPWWEGAKEDVPAAAAQTGKPVVLYFQSPTAAECVRMEEETWQPMNPVWADLQFIWLKLEPRRDADFFKHWQINQVPQVVVLDADMRDQVRLRGFLTLAEMEDALSRVQRGVPSVYTTVNGSILPARNPILDLELIRRDPHKGHVYFENFDAYKLIGSLSNPPFSPVVQASSKIDTSKGTGRTSCLTVDSGNLDTALIQIDISSSFAEIPQVLGRIRVQANLKSETSLGRTPVDVMALYTVRTDSDSPEAEQMYFASLSEKDLNVWRNKEIVSAPINFRLHKAFILLSAPQANTRFLVDDVVVDLIPADDLIPFVDVESRVQTIAAIGGSQGGSAAQSPDSFYDQLEARATVSEPTAKSNALSRPAESDGAGPQNTVKPNQTLTDQQVTEIAEYFRDLSPEDRTAYLKSRKIPQMDRARISFAMQALGIQ